MSVSRKEAFFRMPEVNDPEDSLVSVISDSGGLDLLTEAGELALDQLLEEGVLRDVPVLGTVVKLIQAGLGVKGYLFMRKLSKFAKGVKEDTTEEERSAFTSRLDSEPKYRKKVGEALLIFLERLDDLDKPELLANAFTAFVKGNIDFITFRRLSFAIDRCFTSDLKHLRRLEGPEALSPDIALTLLGAGLLEIATIPRIRGEQQLNVYQITPFGELFVKVVLTRVTS